MGCYGGPDISESGLVLSLDAANQKSYDGNENFFTYSKDFSQNWSANQITYTTNSGLAPDGSNTAALVTTNTVAGYNTIIQSPTLSINTNYCYSVFVKLVSGSGTSSRVTFGSGNNLISPGYASWGLQLDNLTETTDGNIPSTKGHIVYPNGWLRLYMVINTSNQTDAAVSIRFGTAGADNVNTFYIWGAQLEKGSSVGPYYPTTGTTKTRGTIWTDLSGNGNTGTLTNGPTYSSANGGSIVFDGVNDYVNLGNASSITKSSQITINCWVRLISLPVGFNNGAVIVRGDTSYVLYWYETTGSNNRLWFYLPGIDSSLTSAASYLTPSFTTNIWYNISATYDGSSSNLYVNAVLVSTATGKSGLINGSNNIYLGYAKDSDAYPLNGNISQASIYNRALSASEISQNFNAMRGRYGI